MSRTSATPSISASVPSTFQSILNSALERYENNTEHKLLAHPLVAQLESCESPVQILSALQGIVGQFDQRRGRDERLTKWLSPTVHVLHAFSNALGEGVSLVSIKREYQWDP